MNLGNFKISTQKLVLVCSTRSDAIDVVDVVVGSSPVPCIYLLLDNECVYIGQTENFRERIEEHRNFPPKGWRWKHCLFIWDGRVGTSSIFQAEDLRMRLEYELHQLFKLYSDLEVVSTANLVELRPEMMVKFNELLDEIVYLLSAQIEALKRECLNRRLEFSKHLRKEEIGIRVKEEEVDIEKIVDELGKLGLRARNLNRAEKTFDLGDHVCFYRPGSKKPKGYQVTIRGTFLEHMKSGKGFLIMNRGEGYIVPLSKIKSNFESLMQPGQDTLDIFFDLKDKKIRCHNREMDLTGFDLKSVISAKKLPQ